jgi:hypothetical protein
MAHLRVFENHEDYEFFIASGTMYYPNVSVCEEQYEAHYNDNGTIDKNDGRQKYGIIEIDDIEPFECEGGIETGISLTTAETNRWKLKDKSDWLNVSPISGVGSIDLTVEAEEYTNTEEDREGFFTVGYTMPDSTYSVSKYGIVQKKKIDYSKQSLTFKILSGGTINWITSDESFTKTISYSTDNGTTWTDIVSSTEGTSINVNAGDNVMFKGDNATYGDGENVHNYFGGTAMFEIEGNIMSLVDSTGYTTATTLSSAYTFYSLFINCSGLTSAENLVLPATTLAEVCYSCMFYGCTGLTTAPELPATTLVERCYYYMFNGCTNLNYIKCLATDISATDCTHGWVLRVASSGTFHKNSSMSSWTTGDSGIPNGWTVDGWTVEDATL